MKKDKSLTVGLVVCFVAMITIVGAITYSNYEKKVEDKLTKEEEEDSQVTQGDQVQAEIEEEVEVEIIEPEITITDDYVQESPLAFEETEVLMWPVDGNVIIPYSMDRTVYFSTLDQYKYSSAVIISGEVGEEVWAAADGEVTAITEDAQTGTTVTVNLGDGYEAIYGQLDEVHVKQGERLEKGYLIGYLGEPTKYYSVEGCNLYFQLLKDGEPINPLHYLDI
jgi:murein DD-endopeptidase MepM/ murein hydrolase activator NlpD